jgi:hypothetical protein
MRMTINIIATVAGLLGLLWILQGTNIVGGSVMSGQSQWLYAGIVLVIAAAGAFWWANLRRPPSP